MPDNKTPPDLSIGERIKQHRRRAGIPQKALAERIGLSESWLSQVERGIRQVDRFSTILALAAELRVQVSDLTGRTGAEPSSEGIRYEALDKIRVALAQFDEIADMLDPDSKRPTERPPDLARMRRTVVEANQLYQATKYGSVGGLLPGLIRQGHHAVRVLQGVEQRKARGVLAEIYHITAKTLSRVGEAATAWLIAERALVAAREAGDPLLMAASAYHLGNAYQRLGQFAISTSIVLAGAEAIQRNERELTPERISAAGGLYLVAAITAARSKDHADAKRFLGEADILAGQVEDGRNDLWLAFGAANVAIHGIAVAVELDDPIEAIRRGESINFDEIPPELHGRRSQARIDLARAYTQRRMDAAAVNTLLEAEQIAPEALRFNGVVRGLVRDLLKREHRASTPQLRTLATRLGLPD